MTGNLLLEVRQIHALFQVKNIEIIIVFADWFTTRVLLQVDVVPIVAPIAKLHFALLYIVWKQFHVYLPVEEWTVA